MTHCKEQNGQAGCRLFGKPPEFIKVRPAYLTTFIALNGFALAVVVLVASLTIYFAVTSWKTSSQECPECQTTPSPLQIQVFGDSDSSINTVVIDRDKNPWIDELLTILRSTDESQFTEATAREYFEKQLRCDDDVGLSAGCPMTVAGGREVVGILSAINSNLTSINKLLEAGSFNYDLVVNQKKNPWINELKNALHDIGKRQSCIPDTGANPGSAGNNPPEDQSGTSTDTRKCENATHAVTVNMGKPPWVDDLLTSLGGIKQAISSDDSRTRNVVLDPEKNEALINALKGVSRHQPCLTGADKHPGGNGEAPACDVTVALEKPPWIDDSVEALHGAIEFYAIDPVIRSHLRRYLNCDNKRLSVPGLIRFQSSEHSLNRDAKVNIDDFVERIDRHKNKWGVFGFASEEGNAGHNRALSWQRACEVTKHIAAKHNCATNNLDCSTIPDGWEMNMHIKHKCPGVNGHPNRDFLIRFLEEQHFINGVADSRSVVIAACRTK